VNRETKFAWLPLPARRVHEEPEESSALEKEWRNGWVNDGWLFLESYRSVTNIYGTRFRERLRDTNKDSD